MPNSVGLHPGEQYSPLTGLIYVFNLIVGTGCLTLPAAFGAAGWALSAGGILLLALVSYLTTTWVVESMACANAINHWRRMKQLKKRGQVADELVNRTLENAEADQRSTDTSEDQDDHEEESPLITEGVIERTVGEYYAIQEQIEMGQMAELFYPRVWDKAFYLVLCIYLYGDLAIYVAAVAKSLRDSICNFAPNCTLDLVDTDPCFKDSDLTRLDMYRICIVGFLSVMGPFVFFNLTKTKYMQIITTFTRWLAMGVMIGWAIILLAKDKGEGHPQPARVTKLPQLFGVCVYSFMCHHSLPALITPINEKKSILKLLAADFLLILLFYYLLAFTGIFTFAHLQDLYTLNFQFDRCPTGKLSFVYILQEFLLLFPVFTLSTNFPIIAITLRNNLKGLCLREGRRYSFFTTRCLFPILAILPPTLVGLCTSDVEILVGITGAYAGSFIQYVVPATLVYHARKMTLKHIGMGVRNPFSAPLQHTAWLALTCIWAALCQVFVTIYLVEEYR
ncbi:hypothetical protein Pmani_015703 [Petrolisthes manimaculis]|uniref:Amino acid transporter transmembrane domain-containing protein n=1 Tax=Petrolisthes manimaculis TaxID=1843537 RepID=A0AAE1U752_9EUCA|nr:hypothetical protein Pmani_015703 [Petrolisthes manimaculis]